MTDPDVDVRHVRAFPDLAPPPGGLRDLRRRLDAHDRRRARVLALAFVPALAAAAAAAVFLVVMPPRDRVDPALAAAVAQHPALTASAPSPGLAVPLSPRATLYWVP